MFRANPLAPPRDAGPVHPAANAAPPGPPPKPTTPDLMLDRLTTLCDQMQAQGKQLAQILAMTDYAVTRGHRKPLRSTEVLFASAAPLTPSPFTLHPQDYRFTYLLAPTTPPVLNVDCEGISFTITLVAGWNRLNLPDGTRLTVAGSTNMQCILQYCDEPILS